MTRKFVKHAIQGVSRQEQERILSAFSALRQAAYKSAIENRNETYQRELFRLAREADTLANCLTSED